MAGCLVEILVLPVFMFKVYIVNVCVPCILSGMFTVMAYFFHWGHCDLHLSLFSWYFQFSALVIMFFFFYMLQMWAEIINRYMQLICIHSMNSGILQSILRCSGVVHFRHCTRRLAVHLVFSWQLLWCVSATISFIYINSLTPKDNFI